MGGQFFHKYRFKQNVLLLLQLFGFLNAVVWGGNVWFVWKETPWFRARSEAQTGGDLTNKA